MNRIYLIIQRFWLFKTLFNVGCSCHNSDQITFISATHNLIKRIELQLILRISFKRKKNQIYSLISSNLLEKTE